MNCPACGSAVAVGQKFCATCGNRLAAVCASCGSPLPDDAAFCPDCGSEVAARPGAASARTAFDTGATPNLASPAARPGPAAPVAERRLVSVLFCDLVGFTAASQDRDAEDTRDVLSRYYEMARERVERYGGTIEKFVGDAVMAVWGVPTAHEDDPERAVRAAMELVNEVPGIANRAEARAAVVSGEAAVTIGAEGHGMVAGDLVNTAARLQSVAAPGTVLVGESTFRAAQKGVHFEALGPKELRGRDAPVQAWRAVRVVAGRGGRLTQDELEPPFVGRDLELRLLDELFRATHREKRLRLVSITGQAGIGKSRLSREFERHIDGLVDIVYWHQGRCPAYGDGVTYWALAEMVRRRCRIAETDDAQTAGARLRETLEQFVPVPEERERIGHALRALLGLETVGPGPTEQGELYVLWRTFFERIAGTESAVLVFEDLQWADEGLLGFIEHLLEFSRTRPILVVTLARPELLDARSTWGAGLRNFTSLHLEPLPEEAMRELLDGLIPRLPAAARRTMIERAEGIPLYAVETVRMLLADGTLARADGQFRLTREIHAPAVPETLRGLLAARLDALEPGERALVQDASILGQSFTLEALSAVAGEAPAALVGRLAGLVRRELLRLESDPLSPERGQYQFVQELVREVAYATLAKRDRKTRHLAAARHFESKGDESLAGILADHYLEAWRSASVGEEREALAAQARVALRGAADRALRLFAFAQAATFLERLLDVTTDEADASELHERIGDALAEGLVDHELAKRHYRAALEWRRPRDRGATSRLAAKLGSVLIMRGGADALPLLEEAWKEAGETAESADSIALGGQLARALMLQDEPERAAALASQVAEAADRLGLERELLEALNTAATSRLLGGGWTDGAATLFGVVQLAQRWRLPNSELRALNNLLVWLQEFDPVGGRALATSAMELAMRTGRDPSHWLPSVASYQLQDGFLDEARRTLEAAEGRLSSDPNQVIEACWIWARLAALTGDHEELKRLHARQSEVLGQISQAEYRPNDAYERAITDIIAGRPPEYRDPLWSLGARRDVARFYGLAGISALLARDVRGVREAVDRIGAVGGRPGVLRKAVAATLDCGLLALDGRPREAASAFREAIAGWSETGEHIEATIAAVAMISVLGDAPEAAEAERNLRERWEKAGASGLVAFIDRELSRARPPAARIGQGEATPSPAEARP